MLANSATTIRDSTVGGGGVYLDLGSGGWWSSYRHVCQYNGWQAWEAMIVHTTTKHFD